LIALLDYARPGDSVVVAAIDRLGRSVAEVTRTIADLGERRIMLHVLGEGVDTATPQGELSRPPNPRSSVPIGKNSCAGLLGPGSRCIHWPKRSESDEQLDAAISPLPQPESARMVTGERKVNETSLICPHSAASSCP
jgi:hypothetical protein